jgi:hypothetical protein
MTTENSNYAAIAAVARHNTNHICRTVNKGKRDGSIHKNVQSSNKEDDNKK